MSVSYWGVLIECKSIEFIYINPNGLINLAFLEILLAMSLSQSQQNDLKKLGARIKELRKAKGLTQTELAHASDMDFQNIYRLEKGERNMAYLTLREIAKGLGVKLSELLNPLD
jgi:DNA-binding XRE family transcriptional regulator